VSMKSPTGAARKSSAMRRILSLLEGF